MRTLKLLLVMLTMLSTVIAGNASAQTNLATLADYKTNLYTLLNMDTTGNSLVDTATASKFIYRALDQLPVWARGQETKRDTLVTSDNTRWYYLDTLVSQVASISKIDSGQTKVLKQIDRAKFNDLHDEEWTVSEDDYNIEFFTLWGDSIGLYPVPQHTSGDNLSDTLEILYWGESVITAVPREFQMGIVLHARWLAEIRMGRGKEKAALEDYVMWSQRVLQTQVTKKQDPLRNER